MTVRLSCCTLFIITAVLYGCKTTNVPNPSFPISRSAAKAANRDMAKSPKTLARPVVILAGFLDPGLATTNIQDSLTHVIQDGPVITATFAFKGNFDSARDALIAQVEAAVPSSHPSETVEVDVIAHSMGGLVARYASLPRSDGKRLNIARLFTLATPHRGAEWGGGPLPINQLARDMDEHSAFIGMLSKVSHPYPIIPYVMLGDRVVGDNNASPDGIPPRWVDRPLFTGSHLGVTADHRVVADISRRLRNEEPLSHDPPSPLPDFVD